MSMELLLHNAEKMDFMEGIDMNMMEKMNMEATENAMELEGVRESAATYVDGISEYLKSIGTIKRLSEEEERAIGYRILEKDETAINEMVNANLRFAVHIAKKYQNHGLELMDLISEANAGLIHAVEKFDVTMGYRFSTYAAWWMNHYIQRALNAAGKLGHKHGVVSLDTFIGEDKENTLEELLADITAVSPEEEVIKGECAKAVASVLEAFSEREREIIKLRYGFYGRCFTLDEVGKK